jgi:hypothetical protein
MTTTHSLHVHVVLLFVIALAGCHKQPDDTFDEARVDASCEAWCEVAVPCSTHFKEQWEFSNQPECVAECKWHVEYAYKDNEACFDLVLDERECAAELSCEDFQTYEDFAFEGLQGPNLACTEERVAGANCY